MGQYDSVCRRSNHTQVLMQKVTNENLMRTIMKQQVGTLAFLMITNLYYFNICQSEIKQLQTLIKEITNEAKQQAANLYAVKTDLLQKGWRVQTYCKQFVHSYLDSNGQNDSLNALNSLKQLRNTLASLRPLMKG